MLNKLLPLILTAALLALLATGCALLENPALGGSDAPANPTPAAATSAAADAPTPVANAAAMSSEPTAAAPAMPDNPLTPEVLVVGGRSIKQWGQPPPQTIDTTSPYQAIINTSAGSLTVELFTSDAPVTVNNFVFLAREGFYDNVIFHRTIPGFMIQGGDPTGTGAGGPGYVFANEPVQRPYSRGVIAMANAGRDTNGSQFFLMHADYPLPPDYTIFGQTVSGVETIDAIATAPTQTGGEGSTPVTPVVIQSVEITGP